VDALVREAHQLCAVADAIEQTIGLARPPQPGDDASEYCSHELRYRVALLAAVSHLLSKHVTPKTAQLARELAGAELQVQQARRELA
jgi:hypothetical protein